MLITSNIYRKSVQRKCLENGSFQKRSTKRNRIPQNRRTLEPQKLRTLEPQNRRNLEPQNRRTIEPQNLRTLQNLRTVERQNDRTIEPQNSRTVEPQNRIEPQNHALNNMLADISMKSIISIHRLDRITVTNIQLSRLLENGSWFGVHPSIRQIKNN